MKSRLNTLRSPATLRILQLGPPRQDDSPSAPRPPRPRAPHVARRLATARERHARAPSTPRPRAPNARRPPASHPVNSPAAPERARTTNARGVLRRSRCARSAPRPRPAFSAVELWTSGQREGARAWEDASCVGGQGAFGRGWAIDGMGGLRACEAFGARRRSAEGARACLSRAVARRLATWGARGRGGRGANGLSSWTAGRVAGVGRWGDCVSGACLGCR